MTQDIRENLADLKLALQNALDIINQIDSEEEAN
jgi:hypothetical protein